MASPSPGGPWSEGPGWSGPTPPAWSVAWNQPTGPGLPTGGWRPIGWTSPDGEPVSPPRGGPDDGRGPDQRSERERPNHPADHGPISPRHRDPEGSTRLLLPGLATPGPGAGLRHLGRHRTPGCQAGHPIPVPGPA